MAEIRCMAENCFYNSQHGCTSPSLNIDGKSALESRLTSCDTFVSNKQGMKSNVGDPFRDIQIECKASKCIYNSNDGCNAKNIVVYGNDADEPAETCCCTFESKLGNIF